MTEVHQLICATANRLIETGSIDYLEVGVQEGCGLQDVLTLPGLQLAVGVDTWGNDAGGTGRGSPDHVLALLGDKMRSTLLITGSSHVILPGLRHLFDLIFIDGDHSLQGCLDDCADCLALLKPHGIILVDDLDHPQHTYIRGAVTTWAQVNALTCIIHPEGYGVAELSRV